MCFKIPFRVVPIKLFSSMARENLGHIKVLSFTIKRWYLTQLFFMLKRLVILVVGLCLGIMIKHAKLPLLFNLCGYFVEVYWVTWTFLVKRVSCFFLENKTILLSANLTLSKSNCFLSHPVVTVHLFLFMLMPCDVRDCHTLL